MRVFGWSSGADGCAYYRLKLPFQQLARRGHDTDVSQLLLGAKDSADVIVAQRQALPEQSWYWQRICRAGRATCVFEMDDDLFSIEPDNKAAHREYNQPGIHDHVKANMAAADLVTVTTERLAQVARQHNEHVAVLPNCIPAWLLDHQRPRQNHLVVGWAGGNSHGRDFGEIAKPLRRWLQHHPPAEFHAIGWDYTPRVASIKGRTRFTPWTRDTEHYLRSIDFDIGVIPLRPSRFAASKSAIKYLEWAALGIPVIATDTPPYSDMIQDGVTGILVSTAREFEEALTELAKDPGYRTRLGAAAKLHAADHCIEDHAHEWEHAYQAAMARKEATACLAG